MNRRNFLSLCTLPFFVKQGISQSTTKNKKVVWLWLGGGISHIETFTPIPEAPEEYRAINGVVKTSIPGIVIGSDFPLTASLAQDMVFVRSFSHGNAGHSGGTHWLMTGHDFPPADNGESQNKPSIGSIISKYKGSYLNSGIPTYVKTSNIYGDGAAWLGPTYSPFSAYGEAKNNLELHVNMEKLSERASLLKAFDTINRDVDKGMIRAMDNLGQQSLNMLTKNLKDVFDIKKEPETVRNFYGNSSFGQNMLQARRLVENGVNFVTVSYDGWDMHNDISKGMSSLSKNLDKVIFAFINDIKARGMEDEVLLVITSEFGRTPKINKDKGRDHWPGLSTLAMFGGGIKMGQVIGQESARAEYPKSSPITPKDLIASVMKVMEIPQDMMLTDPTGRPVQACDGKPIKELF